MQKPGKLTWKVIGKTFCWSLLKSTNQVSSLVRGASGQQFEAFHHSVHSVHTSITILKPFSPQHPHWHCFSVTFTLTLFSRWHTYWDCFQLQHPHWHCFTRTSTHWRCFYINIHTEIVFTVCNICTDTVSLKHPHWLHFYCNVHGEVDFTATSTLPVFCFEGRLRSWET